MVCDYVISALSGMFFSLFDKAYAVRCMCLTPGVLTGIAAIWKPFGGSAIIRSRKCILFPEKFILIWRQGADFSASMSLHRTFSSTPGDSLKQFVFSYGHLHLFKFSQARLLNINLLLTPAPTKHL